MSDGEFNFENLQMQIDNIEEKVDNIEEKVPTKKEMQLANERLIKKVLEHTDDRYASKRVESLVYGLVGAALIYMVNELLGLL